MSTGNPAKNSWCASALVAFFSMYGACVAADPTLVVPPLPLPGPYPVACSNVAQDFTRMSPGEIAQDYWDGNPRSDGSARYITDLLADPSNTLELTLAVPSDANLYGSFAGQNFQYVIIVCYPTTADNPRADYPLPNGVMVPHMQLGTDAPLLADPTAQFPMLLFSHGLSGSPIDNGYLLAISVPASYGYVVAATFHGDARFSPLQVDDLADLFYLLGHLSNVVALQALRPLSLSATLDLLLANPQWRDHIDSARIGGFGASLGGEALMLMAGAGLTTSAGLSWTQVVNDTRLKAAVGYVPYFGQPFFPAFGRDQHGLDNVTLPFLAISGTADTVAPIASTFQGLERLRGTRELVELVGVTHGFDMRSTNDIFTWTLTFLDAQVGGDAVASARLAQMASVAGGGDDHVVIPYNGPAPGTTPAVEYYYSAWNFYFVTAFQSEIAALDGGAFGGAWQRTGKTFNVWPQAVPGSSPTCRFFSIPTAFGGKSAHFYTPFPIECQDLQTNPALSSVWQLETAAAFYVAPTDASGNCPAGLTPLYRTYNNGIGGAPNHRYTTDPAVQALMISMGWVAEGNGPNVIFACVPQ